MFQQNITVDININDKYNVNNMNKSIIVENISGISNVNNKEDDKEKTKDVFHNASKHDTSVVQDNTDCINKGKNIEARVLTATQLAYEEFVDYIQAIEEDFLLGDINKDEKKIIESEGTYMKINFEIIYIPDEDTMECDTIVLENLEKGYIVKNVTCDCCLNQDTC